MNKYILLSFIIATSLLFGCTKPPDFSDEPVIEFGSLENNNVPQATDTVFVTVNFTDGDGDIGFSDNIEDIFLIDTRPSQGNALTKLFMPMIPELGSENGISGEIRFPIVTCCEPPPGEAGCLPVSDFYPEFQRDTVVFTMYIRDRAGNESNTITLDPIYLLCD